MTRETKGTMVRQTWVGDSTTSIYVDYVLLNAQNEYCRAEPVSGNVNQNQFVNYGVNANGTDYCSNKTVLLKKLFYPILALMVVTQGFFITGSALVRYTYMMDFDSLVQYCSTKLPDFVFEHPYVSSSYYSATVLSTEPPLEWYQQMVCITDKHLRRKIETLQKVDKYQVRRIKKDQLAAGKTIIIGEKDFTRETTTRLAIVRPFCEFDATDLHSTFDVW